MPARPESTGQLALFHPDGTLTRWAKANQRTADDIRRHAEQQRAAVLADRGRWNDFIARCWADLAEAARILDPPLHPAITRKDRRS